MRTPTPARFALAIALALAPAAAARGQADADDPDAADGPGFPWACFAVTVVALGGLYVFVRRREQEVEEDLRHGRGPAAVWFCRACDRDVSGPVCPHCRAANPFGHDLPGPGDDSRPGRVVSKRDAGDRPRPPRRVRPRDRSAAGPPREADREAEARDEGRRHAD